MPISRFLSSLALVAAAFLGPCHSGSGGIPVDPNLSDETYASNVQGPTSMAFAPDGSGRLFVALKSGAVIVLSRGGETRTIFARPTPIYTDSECGVLGICFDPDFLTNHYVYVFITVSKYEQQIVRYVDLEGRGIGRVTVVRGLPTMGKNHDGGSMTIGSDGHLYWGVGDNGVKRGVDRDLRTLAAKIGRAAVSGTAPATNPFADGAGPNNDFIWATGFRNPFKMTVQPKTGLLWVNVVGSSASGQTTPKSGPGFEQIFALHAGEDAGYDDLEGSQTGAPRYTLPFVRPTAKPVLQYRTNYAPAISGWRREVTEVVEAGANLEFNTTSGVPFHVGELVTYTPAGGASELLVVSSLKENGFSSLGAKPALAGTTGSVTPLAGQGCVAAGAFYESSRLDVDQGSYFFGDFNSGDLFQVKLSSDNQPASPAKFLSRGAGITDVILGPDGAIYYASYQSNSIHRIAPKSESVLHQGLGVTPTTLRLVEGIPTVVNVSLRQAPASNVEVSATVTSGTSSLEIVGSARLLFTPQNWQTPQALTVKGTVDVDFADTEAEISFSGIEGKVPTIHAYIKDVGATTPLLSTSSLQITEGGFGTFTVSLPEKPLRPITLAVRKVAGSPSIRVATTPRLIFTPENWSEPRTVRISGARDRNTVIDSATIEVLGSGYWPRAVAVSLLEP